MLHAKRRPFSVLRKDFTFVKNTGKRVKLGGRNLMPHINIKYADEESMVSG
jgi:hypothetical protein